MTWTLRYLPCSTTCSQPQPADSSQVKLYNSQRVYCQLAAAVTSCRRDHALLFVVLLHGLYFYMLLSCHLNYKVTRSNVILPPTPAFTKCCAGEKLKETHMSILLCFVWCAPLFLLVCARGACDVLMIYFCLYWLRNKRYGLWWSEAALHVLYNSSVCQYCSYQYCS